MGKGGRLASLDLGVLKEKITPAMVEKEREIVAELIEDLVAVIVAREDEKSKAEAEDAEAEDDEAEDDEKEDAEAEAEDAADTREEAEVGPAEAADPNATDHDGEESVDAGEAELMGEADAWKLLDAEMAKVRIRWGLL